MCMDDWYMIPDIRRGCLTGRSRTPDSRGFILFLDPVEICEINARNSFLGSVENN